MNSNLRTRKAKIKLFARVINLQALAIKKYAIFETIESIILVTKISYYGLWNIVI